MSGMKVGSQCTSSHTKTATGFAFVICLQGERWRRGSPQWLLGWSQLGIWDDLDSLRLRCARQTFASPVSSHQNSGHTRTSHQNSGQRATFPARSGSAVPRPFISGAPNPKSGKFNSCLKKNPRLPPKPPSRGGPREGRRGRVSQLQAATARARHRRNCRRNCKRNCW